ncbi:MAG TPA: sigma-70 family RNA polymerase sigma factor [Rhodanobacteraceae bacterium]|nr:sigma-70 family RNA polymerase sigma factor [Rhodanobacteraceae bacterium]
MEDRERRRRFETLLHEHQRIVFKVARVYARDAHERDDLVQDIAVQLWRSFAGFDPGRAKFSTWMYRVALNVAISTARSARRSSAGRLEPLEVMHLDSVADPGVTPYEAMERDQRLIALHAFVEQLDALNRALVLLCLEDRSYAEIADVLGISETNVATKLNRIKNKLRGQMAAPQTEGVKNGTR